MHSLVDIAVFGIGGAIVMAALIGLLLVVSRGGREGSPLTRALFGSASVAVLVVLPALAAATALPKGFWAAFAAAACVAAVLCTVNVLLLPAVTRRGAGAGTALAAVRPTLPVLAAVLVLCAALGLLGAGAAALLA
ncbi:hypothetical protein [Nocardiopsis sp. CNT312]|uniref:hypothetical protein n=1 Tax=Nocardiopsis sp. CNT312 TaxID=1137268 RepID=UPI0004909041|nr:hypothetical protein [Nocardiopsis sp. CNT312]